MFQSALSQITWRVSELLHRLLLRLEDRLAQNPFQILRNRLGSILAMIFDAELLFDEDSTSQINPRVQNLIDKVAPKIQFLAENPNILPKENSLTSGVANVRLNDTLEVDETQKISEEKRTAAINLFKTICKWMVRTDLFFIERFFIYSENIKILIVSRHLVCLERSTASCQDFMNFS